jgi:cytochrome P450
LSNQSDTAISPFNPFTSAFLSDPYPTYKALRDEDPVHWSPVLNAWLLTRYQDAVTALRDPRLGREPRNVEGMSDVPSQPLGPFRQMQLQWLVFRDPPDHTRLRTLLNKAFTHRVAERLRPKIQEVAHYLLDQVQDKGRMDIIADYAFPLPVIVIAELLGIPVEDRQQLRLWANDLVGAIDITETPEVIERAGTVTLQFYDYLRDLLRERRKHPKDDLISRLIAAEEQGDRLSEDELLGMCVFLLLAGHDTTLSLVGNGMLSLLRYPDQYEKLQRDDALIPTAVEEFLRYESPVQMTFRLAFVDMEIGGKAIQKGQYVCIGLAAANRDPAQFPDPDRLDITRRENKHLAFGGGIHYCPGAPLGLMEGQTAISTLLRRMPNLRLENEEAAWRRMVVFRGLKTLPVSF